LCDDFAVDQLPRDGEARSAVRSERLRTPESPVIEPAYAARRDHLTVPVELDECRADIAQPAQGLEAHAPRVSQDDKTPKARVHPREAPPPTCAADAVLDDQVSALDANPQAEAAERENALTGT
jgi:hypothetical protein